MSVWEEIKSKLSVEEVISDYVPIQSSGGHFRCICPFHTEKSPSLIISPDKQIWHCFGCGAGGNIFSFVAQYENIEMRDALKKLAAKAGVELQKFPQRTLTEEEKKKDKEEKTKYEQGLDVLAWVSEVYHKILLNILKDQQNPITQYCLKRKLTPEIISLFHIGYAPKGGFLLKIANKYGISKELMHEVGVLKTKENSINNSTEFSDKFSDRLMIPIQNKEGKVVGFTGRVLPYDTSERPKYLNSPQTEWFNKGELWFGWPLAKRNAISQKKVIIVEGNMDVISAFSHGFNYTIASQGTSFTHQQITLLKQLRAEIWLAYDNDNAGQIAGNKFFLATAAAGLEIKKVLIPETMKDLDDYLNSAENIDLEVLPYPEFLLKKHYSQLTSSDSDEQKKAVEIVLQALSVVDDLTMEQYVSKLNDITDIRSETLYKLIKTEQENTQYSQFTNQGGDSAFEPDKKPVTPTQQALVLWQKMASLQTFLGNMDEWEPHLTLAFALVKHFIKELQPFELYTDYVQAEKDLLNVIFTDELTEKSPVIMKRLWTQMMFWIDHHIEKILLDEELKDIYLALKQER